MEKSFWELSLFEIIMRFLYTSVLIGGIMFLSGEVYNYFVSDEYKLEQEVLRLEKQREILTTQKRIEALKIEIKDIERGVNNEEVEKNN